jgi:hypothetical protein
MKPTRQALRHCYYVSHLYLVYLSIAMWVVKRLVSRLAANQAYPKLPNHPLAIRHLLLTDSGGECPPRRSRR